MKEPRTLEQIDWCVSVSVSVCMHSPEAHDGTLLADVALGLVLGRLGGGHAVQHGQPHHGLGLHAHPVHKLPGLQLHLVTHLKGTNTQGFRTAGDPFSGVCWRFR